MRRNGEADYESQSTLAIGAWAANERWAAATEVLMSLVPGTRLSDFEVSALIGAGGMGEVYRAKDLRLGREVAIKVLPEAFAKDKDRLARFEREARLLAQLNHSNIAGIHDIQESDGTPFLVMELVEGPTLADRIVPGALSVEQALPIFAQIAEALENAHEHGVIHRDLKPANIKVTEEGKVKVLDFGLAKAFESQTDSHTGDTMTLQDDASSITGEGEVLGTPAYMSPEQASGRLVDKRADIWAFGCCLYEALTGKRPFNGETASDLLADILKSEPDWNALPTETPPRVRILLWRCLQKSPQRRLRDIGDARIELDESGSETSGAFPVLGSTVQRSGVDRKTLVATSLTTAAIVGLVASFVTWLTTRPVPHEPEAVHRFTIRPPSDWRGVQPASLTFSPDGSKLAFSSWDQPWSLLMVRSMDAFDAEARPIDGTEDGYNPFFSSDGEWLGFMVTETPRTVRKVPLSGGEPGLISERPGNGTGASWGEDGNVIFGAMSTGLWRVDASGGEAEEITTPDKGGGVIGHVLPSHLPGGKHVLYTAWTGNPSTSFTALLSLETLESTPLIMPGMGARYASSGHIVYGHEGALYGVAFDVWNLEVSGTATAMVQDVAWGRGGFQGPQFDISIAGTLAYVRGASSFHQQVLVWVNRAGLAERLPIEPAKFGFPRISPDGQRLAVRVASDEARNIWIYDTSGRAPYPVTFGEVGHVAPIWTPDGRNLIYSSWGSKSVHRVAAAPGNEEPELILRMEDDLGLLMNLVSSSISPDGRIALVTNEDRESGADIWAVPLDGGEAYALIQTPSDEYTGRISPDGKWLAYGSNLTGRREVWVRPFADPTAGKSLPLTSAGGISPVWSRDGQELFYLENNQQKMMVISVPRAESEDWGRPEELFSTPRVSSRGAGLYAIGFDVAPDGRFIFVIQEGDSLGKDAELAKRPSPEIHIVTNWFEELRRLVPTRGDENN